MLTQEQQQLVQMVQTMSPEQVRRLLNFSRSLLEPSGTAQVVDESDRWSEEDLRDFTNASLRYAEETIPFDEPGTASKAD